MAVFDRVAIDHWQTDEIVQKFPKGGLGDIKLGSPCIVNPYEVAVFVRSGKALGTLEPGTHVLTTANVPFLTNLLETGLFGGKNVFTADVYYLKTSDMTLKWGTAQPVIVEHPQRGPGATAMIGNGNFVVKVNDPWRFLQAMDAFRDSVRFPQVKDRLDPMLGVMLQDKLSELAIAKNLGPAQIQSFSKDLNDALLGMLQSEFDALGLILVDFNIRLSPHPDSLEVVTRMGYGTSYSQVAALDAAQAAAANPSGSSLAETGLGLAGLQAAQQQMMNQQMMQQQMTQQQMAQQQPAQSQSSDSGMTDVMTPAQAAAIVQVSEADIIAAIESGDLKARKIGTAYRISKANLEAFLSG
jgi:excisionase family DNA binding protein